MLIQDFLRNGGSLADLQSKYFIKAKRHNKYNNLVLFKYNQIDSPMGDPLVQECRGLILDETNDWHIVAHPFNKFFNYGEGHAKPIDWNTARVQQKYDGSMCTLYFYDGGWNVATTGTPDASGQVNDFGLTFNDMFWDTWNKLKYNLPDDHLTHLNFMFELMRQENRVVVRHTEPNLVLIGVRDLISGNELPVDAFAGLDWAYAHDYPLNSFESIIGTFKDMDPLQQEGYVVVDDNFNRVKVKHPGYVAIHHLRDNLCVKRILEIVRAGEYSELISYYPEFKPKFDEISKLLSDLKDEVHSTYESIKDIKTRKEFAAHAVKTRCPDILFSLYSGKVKSIGEYVANVRIEYLISVLKLKNTETIDE